MHECPQALYMYAYQIQSSLLGINCYMHKYMYHIYVLCRCKDQHAEIKEVLQVSFQRLKKKLKESPKVFTHSDVN